MLSDTLGAFKSLVTTGKLGSFQCGPQYMYMYVLDVLPHTSVTGDRETHQRRSAVSFIGPVDPGYVINLSHVRNDIHFQTFK